MARPIPKSHFLRQFVIFCLTEGPMKITKIIRLAALLALLPTLSGCWYLIAGGAGAYGGYKMKEKGYILQNPITKEKSNTRTAK